MKTLTKKWERFGKSAGNSKDSRDNKNNKWCKNIFGPKILEEELKRKWSVIASCFHIPIFDRLWADSVPHIY